MELFSLQKAWGNVTNVHKYRLGGIMKMEINFKLGKLLSMTLLKQYVGIDDLQRSIPNSIILAKL